MPPLSVKAEETPSTLTRIRRFNPWLSADDPLELPLKLHSLLRDEYTFFRGTADLYYDWCKDHCADWMAAPGDFVTLHGDIHLGNIGTYRAWTAHGAANRFAVVDLDETFHGPYQLDLFRGILSLRLAASDNHIDLSLADCAELMDRFMEGYADGLTGRVAAADLARRHDIVKSLLKKAAGGDPAELADKFCKGKPPRRFHSARLKKGGVSDIMTPVDDSTRKAVAEAVRALLESDVLLGAGKRIDLGQPNAEKGILDIVRWSRIDSGGSQGLRKYLVLIAPHAAWDDKPLILQLKEEPAPSAARAGLVSDASGPQRAAQVANTYALLNDPPCRLVGHVDVDGRGYLIRTKDPFSEEPEAGDFKTRAALMDAAGLLGETLGQAHRAGCGRLPAGGDRIVSIAAALTSLSPRLAARTEAALSHLHRAYANLRQDPIARKLVESAKRRIEEAAASRRLTVAP